MRLFFFKTPLDSLADIGGGADKNLHDALGDHLHILDRMTI